jgi:hypothetical protein
MQMRFELNPLRWFRRTKAIPSYDHAQQSAWLSELIERNKKLAENEEKEMANKFVGILEAIGKGFEKGLAWAVKYAVPVEKIVALIFPPAAAAATEVADATTLIQNAVLLVEQKYAASGAQTGTGAQKLAEVLTLVESAVTSLLKSAGIAASTAYVSNLVSAVVAILNVQDGTTATTTTTATATA